MIVHIATTVNPNNEYPVPSQDLDGNDEEFSVDVITCNKDGRLDIGFYNYDTKKWLFHTDTITDPYEFGEVEDFVWMYAPKELTNAVGIFKMGKITRNGK